MACHKRIGWMLSALLLTQVTKLQGQTFTSYPQTVLQPAVSSVAQPSQYITSTGGPVYPTNTGQVYPNNGVAYTQNPTTGYLQASGSEYVTVSQNTGANGVVYQTGQGVPYNEAAQPPNYGNAIGPAANAIAPNINPYPRLSRCVVTGEFLARFVFLYLHFWLWTTGYPCNHSIECCTAGCDVYGPFTQCCIPEGQVCDFQRPVQPNHYACCYPMNCDPYRNTGITICQERNARYPDGTTKG